jgi:hypothetical protein
MGSYNPFLQSYKYALEKYDPLLKGIDATGPQKALDELAFENAGIKTDKLNFGAYKDGMLNALSLDISNHRLVWPPISGLRKQMGSYSRERDDKKLAQDIVMTLAQISYLARYVPDQEIDLNIKKTNYRPRKVRTTTTRRR